MKFRYLRIYAEDSEKNGSNHYISIRVLETGSRVDVIAGKPVNHNRYDPAQGKDVFVQTSLIPTNGNLDTNNYFDIGDSTNYILIDLGREVDVMSIEFLRYYGDFRTYRNTRVLVAGPDGNYFPIFDAKKSSADYKENGQHFSIVTINDVFIPIIDEILISKVARKCGLNSNNCSLYNTPRLRDLINKPDLNDKSFSLRSFKGVTTNIPFRRTHTVVGSSGLPSSLPVTLNNVSTATSTPGTFSSTTLIRQSQRKEYLTDWVVYVGERIVASNVSNPSGPGTIIGLPETPPYENRRRITRNVSKNPPYNTVWDQYAVDERRSYQWTGEYQGDLARVW